MKFIDKFRKLQKMGTQVQIPWEVWTKLGYRGVISIVGDEVCLGSESDCCTLENARKAVQWYAEQLGGAIKWEK